MWYLQFHIACDKQYSPRDIILLSYNALVRNYMIRGGFICKTISFKLLPRLSEDFNSLIFCKMAQTTKTPLEEGVNACQKDNNEIVLLNDLDSVNT